MTPSRRAPMPDLTLPTRAKVVATLGPASDSEDVVARLIEAGVTVFRLNFSHGNLDEHERRLRAVRKQAEAAGVPVAVFGDLCGPKIRVGMVPRELSPDGGLQLAAGQDVVFRRGINEAAIEAERSGTGGGGRGGGGGEGGGGTVVLPVTYPGLIDEVQPGQRVLINDGAVRMLAVERAAGGNELRCRVTHGGLVTTGKGVNLPDTDMQLQAITERDWECAAWAVRQGLDFLALSFIRRAEEILELKGRLRELCAAESAGDENTDTADAPPVIAKIEKPQAVAGLDRIIDAADAIMVARGDLGVEMELAAVPVVQKRILAGCQAWGKPCIVATQMLETMIGNSSPTRAEASDVANAVFDGADALMLSGETAVGRHPALAAETMRRIIAAAEAHQAQEPRVEAPPQKLVESRYATAALAHGAWHIAGDVGAKLIVCWSQAGGTARYLSQNDFRVPIVAYTTSAPAARRMALLRGVTPIRADAPGSLAAFTELVERDMLARGWAHRGDPILLLAGNPLGKAKATNSIATCFIGDPAGGYRSHRP